MDIALSPDAKQQAGRSVWSADVGLAAALVTEVQFDMTSPTEFIRSVIVSSSEDGKDWGAFANAEIYRYRRGDAEVEQLSVTFLATAYRSMRHSNEVFASGNCEWE